LAIASVWVACPSFARTDGHQEATPDTTGDLLEPEVTSLGEGFYLIGRVLLDSDARTLYMPARVNMNEGLVELLACGPMGKTHESVLVVTARPEHIQVGLILLGLESGGGLEYQGDPRTPHGDSVWVWVEWQGEDGKRLTRGEDLVINYNTKKPMEHTHWVFSGSMIMDGKFVASVEQSIVTTYHDPMTILDNPLPTGADDTLYGANPQVVPDKGKPMVLVFTADSTRPVALSEIPEHIHSRLTGSGNNEKEND
jgi:hypothetical protein